MIQKILIITFMMMSFSCTSVENKYPITDHYDGEKFFNPKPADRINKSFFDFLKWKLFGKPKDWPKKVDIKQSIPQRKVESGLVVTFVNHATALIQMEGVNIITDPIWSQRTSPVSWAGPRRIKKPGVAFENLPKIDIVLISHNHYDHMDKPTIKKLIERDQPVILFGLGNKRHFSDDQRTHMKELDWGDRSVHKNLEITFLRSRHWSKRSLTDAYESLWGAFVIQGQQKVYFAGDSGYATHFKEAGEQFDGFDLALIPIGAYEPRWFMKAAHINPVEALRAHKDLNAKKSLGIHFGTFQLSDEGVDEPADALREALKNHGINPNDFIVLENGEVLEI